MRNNGVGGFRYFVGINSLAEVATREDRVCVLNILGGESSDVTPVGHAYSGGNVVFGTSPGKKGQVLDTPVGPIPVYNNVRDGMNAGHAFNCGVVYLPPSAADDGVVELVRVNPDSEEDLHPDREDVACTTRARCAPWRSSTASTSSAATASAWPTPGTRCASAARWAATTRAIRCARAPSPSCPIRAASPPPSRSTCAWPAGARPR